MKFGRAAEIGLGIAGGVGLPVAAIAGARNGMSQNNVSDQFYDLTTGNSNIDQEVLGTKMGVREALFPYMGWGAGEFTRRGAMSHGGVGGLVAGYQSGLINKVSAADQFTSARNPLMSDTQALQYRNRPPTVSGDVVFGQYNSRMG